MRIYGNNATQYGNARKQPTNAYRQNYVSPNTYCISAKAAGKNIIHYRFTDIGELPIQLVYRSVSVRKYSHIAKSP